MHCTRLLSWSGLLLGSLAAAAPAELGSPDRKRSHRPSKAVSHSFAGVNSYFLHAFQTENRTTVLDAVRDAGLKYVRIFISETPANNKETGSVYMPDIEPVAVGQFDDTQLEAIDQLMVDAHARDIKLVIAIHDRYQLGCWGNDTYAAKFNLPEINCAATSVTANNVTSFYLDPTAIQDYDNRIQHVLEHRNHKIRGSPRWKDLHSHIFAFNIENEGEGHLNNNTAPVPEWWCDRATFMRRLMGRSKVLISTGGGNEFSNSDIPQNWACPALDIVDMHSYSDIDVYKVQGPLAVQNAVKADKFVIFEEFGATGDDKAELLQQYIDFFNSVGAPWSPWEISKPGKGAGDFEFWTDEPSYEVVKNGSEIAQKTKAAQSWSKVWH